MSTGLNCEFVEVEPGVWYYVLEQGSAPKQSWDWREFADAYGPFHTHEEAQADLHENHANPGGSDTRRYAEGYRPDDNMKRLIEAALRRRW